EIFNKFESKVTAPRNPKLIRTTELPKQRMTPSMYMREMNMNTEQKLADTHEMRLPRVVALLDMSETTHQKVSYVDIEEAMFQPFPSEIYFQNFEPFQTYEVPLLVRNNDKVPRLVKVVQNDSPYFKIISPDDVSHKVAPGMASIFKIQFTPEMKKDYHHELICMTEREKFIVPVFGIGARAILDFPDEVNFGVCPVKHNTQKVLFVRNIGNKEAKCSFLVDPPFSVSTSSGLLAVGDSMQVTVEFKAMKVGDHQKDLIIRYNTGEDVHVALYGASADSNVRLDKNSLRIDNTFIFMANQRTVTIHNRSNVLVHYKWSPFPTLEDEEMQKQKFCSELTEEENQEQDRFLEECIVDPTLRDRLAILTRTFDNRRNIVKDDPLLFNDDVFKLYPLEGDIWPNSTAEATIVFKPTAAKTYQQTIFCDITGRETRLPLKVKGCGMGPKLHLSFDVIDIGNVFASSSHTYEAILVNKGDIDAIFNLVPERESSVSRFSEFRFEPVEGIVLPSGHQALEFTFRSERLGSFQQDFSFSVDGSPDQIKLTVKGNVIGPTFHFDVPRLRFGTVSYGFNHTKICTLVNTSLVPMTFVLRIPGDGKGEPSISSLSCLEDNLFNEIGASAKINSPREFDITPVQGTIRPQSEARIQVTLCSNTLKRYDCQLVVDVKGVGKEILSLPISAKSVVPNIQVLTPHLDFGRCFINHPYQLKAKLVNDTDLAAKYDLVPQVREELTTVVYGSSATKGLIEPHSEVNVPILIQAQDVDDQEVTAYFSIFGSPEPPLVCFLSCIGEGPVVHITPESMNWGQTEVLTPSVKTVELSNESLIPADFIAQMMRSDSIWKVEPEQGTVPPESVLIVSVTAMLDDCIRFTDKLTVTVIKGPTVTIPVHAYGHGTTIVAEPPLTPAVSLGPHFAKSKCIRRFRLTNRGRRHQALTWSTDGFVKPKSKRENHAANAKDSQIFNNYGKKTMAAPPPPPEPVFQLRPTRLALEPGQSAMVTLEGYCDVPRQVCETLLCHAIIGKANGKERIIRSAIRADFISPVLELSKDKIEFRVDKRPDDVTALTPKTRTFVARNISSLPLTCVLHVEYPFQILDFYGSPQSQLEINLAISQELEITVRFDPAFKDDLVSRVAEGEVKISYKEHPHMDSVKLKGEVNFPNLDFDKSTIDFGCILNDTEVARYVDITNTSPLPVAYRWSFVVTEGEQNIRWVFIIILMDFFYYYLKKILYCSNQEENIDLPPSTEWSKEELAQHDEVIQQALEEERRRTASRISSRSQPSHPFNTRAADLPLLPWLQPGASHVPNGVEEVFDILPLYGTLEPGETQRVTFTYYGHADVSCNARAVCEVQGGPKYDVKLEGEASLIEYKFDRADVDCLGTQMFDQVAVGELRLENTGRVGFNFVGLAGLGRSGPSPGVPVLKPSSGHVPAFSDTTLVLYLPGIPEHVHKSIQIQVAHFEPAIINVLGEGVFPRLALDLPRFIPEDERYASLVKEAKENLEHETNKQPPGSLQSRLSTPRKIAKENEFDQNNQFNSNIHMEVERLLLREFASENQHFLAPGSVPDPSSGGKSKKKKKFPRVRLTDYLLDFGYVVLGNVRSHIVRATNTSHFPISFSADRSSVSHSGFSVELDRVKQLPGAPDHETVDFKVTFDPRGANIGIGPIEAVIPVNILGGPQICMRLRAHVAVPDLSVSNDVVDFEDVQCGQCKVVTVQLHNEQHVRCEWTSINSDRRDNIDKHVPMHLRRKLRKENKPKPNHFEMMPSHGFLAPGQRMNVQIKFMPTEERHYSQRLLIHITQGTSRVSISVRGSGLEPQLDFEPNLVEFGPILPHGVGDEVDVVVRNPTPFSVELYSLDFDKQYLHEEKILRMMKGYDEHSNLLLPPRRCGEDLPPELLGFYQEQEEKIEAAKIKSETEVSKTEGDETEDDTADVDVAPSSVGVPADESAIIKEETQSRSELDLLNLSLISYCLEQCAIVQDEMDSPRSRSMVGVGDLEITPVSAAIARHLGIDLSPEGRAARNRRGIAVIVHGPPTSGKTNTSVLLAKTYGAARLTIDGIIMEAISSGTSQAGLRARELCANTARGLREEEADGTNMPGGLSVEAVTAHTGAGHSIAERQHPFYKVGICNKIFPPYTGTDSKMGGTSVISGPANKKTNSHQVPSSPPPPVAPIARRLSVSASVAGEEGLVSCVLPEDLLVEIISERIQLNDCHQGVVFDGLETLFSGSHQATALALLKSINNRKHIYFVSQKLDYNVVRARQRAKAEETAKSAEAEEEQRRNRLEDMDEDEYDALPEEEKEAIDQKRLEAKRLRLRREAEERNERERLERERVALLEERRLEEESSKKKGRKSKQADGVPSGPPGGAKDKGQPLKTVASVAIVGQQSLHDIDKRPESRATERPESIADDGKKTKKGKNRPVSEDGLKESIDDVKDDRSDAEKMMQQRFKLFDLSLKDLSNVLEHWDRSQLIVNRSSTPEGGGGANTATSRDKAPPSGKKGSKKEREKERLERERQEKERAEKEKADRERIEKEKADREKQRMEEGIEVDGQGSADVFDGIGVPHIQLDANDPENPCCKQILELGKLPTVNDVLDGLGLGPKGPPIPPPAMFSVIPFPVKRKPPSGDKAQHYEFVASSPDDPNIGVDDQASKEPEPPPEEPTPSEVTRWSESRKEDPAPPSRKGKNARTGTGRKSSPRRSRRGSTDGGKISPPIPITPGSEADQSSVMGESSDFKVVKLSHFRWVVPAYGETILRVRFSSEELGQFDQTLNFEIVGTRRRYQVFCRGVCSFPTICREPRIVFPHRKKTKPRPEETVAKKYILQEEVFEFGPLLCGKTRERYKEGRYPENMEQLTIMNTSPLPANISFCFQHDSNATTFLLDPPNISLEPNESKALSVWAYPKTAGRFMDCIVCCVRENPEPICFNVACHGVRPELELDRKHLHFDKVLLHRKDTRTLYLRNSTMLAVAWKVAGMENMGDDFSLNQDVGVIEPRCEFALQLHFRATKAMNLKKTIRLEISDVENIMGLVQTENVQVTAEAYDVALDMSFPKGADGGLDFGTIRVMDESKQTCSLKNKGKYEIGFNFLFEKHAPNCPPVDELFSVLPQKGTLIPNDRPTQVQVIFRSRTEITIRDVPLLKCQVIEPNIGDGKEIIASIPIKLAVRSLFTKYVIFPSTDINFGPMVINTKKTRTFTIENKGEFDFKYTIVKMIREAPNVRPRPMVLGGRRAKSRDGSSSTRGGRAASIRQDMGSNQTRLLVGTFTVYPGFGTILPGGVQNITVDNVAENTGKSEEFLSIDISDRDPVDNASGIPYRLLAEGCVPSINTGDITSIFEEHRICKNLHAFSDSQEFLEGSGVYGEEDGKFVFCNVVVGRKSYARFKISNTNKVAVDVSITVKALSNKVAARIHDIFEVEPSKIQIQPHNFMYATVSFCPPAMNSYSCNFEANVDGLPSSVAKGRNLSFEITGEGNLPRVTVMSPKVRNKSGEPLLVFQRLLLQRTESLPLVLKNEGTFPSKVLTSVGETRAVFPMHNTRDTSKICALGLLAPSHKRKWPYTASVVLTPGEEARFNVTFTPMMYRVYNGQIKISIVDNLFEEHRIQLYGEGFKDDVTFDNLHSDGDMASLAGDDGIIDTDGLPKQMTAEPSSGGSGGRGESLMFGDCDVGVAKDRSFMLTNHSQTDAVRFQWSEHDNVKFVPTVGHIHPGCSKDITVTFKADQPVELKKTIIKCSLVKINFPGPIEMVTDWDDRMRTVKWVDVASLDPKKAGSRPEIIETEKEPDHLVAEESSRCLELFAWAKSDHAKLDCDTTSITFKDTLMFQARLFEFTMCNTGQVALQYDWQLVMEALSIPGTTSCSTDLDGRPSTANQSSRSAGGDSSLRSLVTDDDAMPFSISPSCGKIAAGSKQVFLARFSPHEVTEYQARLLCTIPNLPASIQEPSIKLRGRSLMPYCHFDLPESDYLSSSRRNPELSGPAGAQPGTTLDPNTRVIEFNSIGVNVKNTCKFWIMNPTSSTYSFRWICDDVTDARVAPNFSCKLLEGQLISGKKLEMCFEFLPNSLDTKESFWKFVILEQNISIPFLLVGHTHEPKVSLSASHINFNDLLVGRTASQPVLLVNNESIGFNYYVIEESCHSEAYTSNLIINPTQGFIGPNSKIPLDVTFTAKSAGDANFNATICVVRKTNNLMLNVKASGHTMSASLLCENSQGAKIELSPAGLNAIDLGNVELHEKAVRQLHLVNNGKHNFNFSFGLKQNGKSFSPEKSKKKHAQEKKCLLTFQPTALGSIAPVEMTAKVTDGPNYLCHVIGNGVNPGLDFSFDSHDFGACFIYRAGMPIKSETLTIINKDTREISVECLYQSTSHLDVAFSATVVAPGEETSAVFTFYPREVVTYNETVTFQVNGLSKHDVVIKGKGTEMRVEVANQKHKLVKFGALRVGQAVKHIIPIVNRSPTPITLNLSVTPVSQPLQDPTVLRVVPLDPITLQGKGGSRDIEVYFTPKTRIASFTEEIMMECAGMSQPLFIISGSCQGIEITLDQDSIPFGAVMQRSRSERRFIMHNVGDIGAGFRWEADKFHPDFSITPTQGYISTGMEIAFSVAFHPTKLCQDIRYDDLKCHIEGAKPLKLTLTGMCVATPALKEVVGFSCHVRGRDVRNVIISNRTNQRWTLHPVIDGEYWSGADILVVEPQQSKQYEMIFRPTVMTMDGKKHQGSVFFPLPDGLGLLYNLQGQADPPKPVSSINRDVPCKTAYVELLSVANWLRKPQRFKATVEMIKPDKLDAGTTLKGLDYIDVPGSVKRDYKLHFYAHKEGNFGAKVIFRNERSGEYIFYYVTLRATSAGVMSTIELETPVRRSAVHTLRVENPLAYAVTFQSECKAPDINLPPQFAVPANSEGTCMFEYQPLKVGEGTGKLVLTNSELGSYTYDLVLRATPAAPEKTSYFKTALGGSYSVNIKFQNYAKQKSDYICKIDSPEWSCEKSITAAPASSGSGTEVTLDVTYEPMEIGESRARLYVTSQIGGEYIFPLEGKCGPPKPLGPFVVRNKSNVSIPFRNVFPTTTHFTFQIDNPLFSVKPAESIRSKKTHNISVSFEGGPAPGSVVTGKLTLSCVRTARNPTTWVFYLKGITPEQTLL
uniref:Hydin adenylate kinase-like domain-containing protein n=1 Tax=Ciona intestinalis TaxID=7719 RepID=H2XZ27_CIOIN